MRPHSAAHRPSPHPAGPCHVVLITPYYWPILSASAHLMRDLAEGLAEAGCQVTVLTNGRADRERPPGDHPLLQGRVHRAWNPFLRRLGVLPKLLEYAWYTLFFLGRGMALRRVDLLFVASTPPLAGIPAAILAWMKGARLVYNLQDIFPDSAVVAGMLNPAGRVYRWLRKAEMLTYRRSHMVISISPDFSDYVQRLVPGTEVATIPNWVDTDLVKPRQPADDPAIETFRRGGAFVVQYAGTIGFMQHLDLVLEAAHLLESHAGIRFVFIGDGNAKQSLQERASALGLSNCEFLPLQPLTLVPTIYNACDVGIIPLRPGAAHIAVPSKTWNYLSAARPVIGCVDAGSPLANILEASGAGSWVPPDDVAGLCAAILAYHQEPARALRDGRRGREYVETHLSRQAAIRRYLEVFSQVLGRTAGSPALALGPPSRVPGIT